MGIDKHATLPPPLTTRTCNKNCKNIYVQTMYMYLCRFEWLWAENLYLLSCK